MTYSRQLTSTEKIYVASNYISPPCVNTIILEGSGQFKQGEWLGAVSKAAEVNPGCRLIMKGPLFLGHWIDSGQAPAVTVADGWSWSGYSPENALFLQKPLSAEQGPTCEVVLINGSPLRVAFRSHHAVMDGMGTILWMQEVFRALRGEPLVGHPSRLTEFRLARSFQKKGRTPAPHHFPALTGKAIGDESGFRWLRITIAGHIHKILPRVAWILAKQIWKTHYHGCPVRFAIPVNMRSRGQNILSTGNLSNLVYLDITPGSNPASISQDLKTQLRDKSDGMLYWGDRFIRCFPLSLIENSIRREIQIKCRSGLYRNSGIISNVGVIPIDNFKGGGFNAENIFGLPIGMENIPFFLGMIATTERTELIMGMANKLANGRRLERVLRTTAEQLGSMQSATDN